MALWAGLGSTTVYVGGYRANLLVRPFGGGGATRVATDGVLVVGAGPTGLMLACELALGGVKARLVDERAEMPNITRAFAVHARTLELLDARGLADELIRQGFMIHAIAPPGGVTLNLRELHSRFGMLLIAPQSAAPSSSLESLRPSGKVRSIKYRGMTIPPCLLPTFKPAAE